MKTLFILRHAKSSWENAEISDFDRPLNPRGLESAPLVGNFIYKNKLAIDLILSSPAKRAKQTAVLVKAAGQITADVQFEDKIYEASSLKLLQIICSQQNEHESVLLVGHNPGLEGLIKLLTGETRAMKTAALAKINVKAETWKDVCEETGQLEFLQNFDDELKAAAKD